MIEDFSRKWEEISDQGYAAGRFRVCPDHLLDLFLSWSVEGKREFQLAGVGIPLNFDSPPSLQNIAVAFANARASTTIVLTLLDSGLKDLFSVVCVDLVAASNQASTRKGAVEIFLNRLARWAELLRKGWENELSREKQLALLGELSFVSWLIVECNFEPRTVVSGWRGPLGETNDVGLNGVRVEIKAQGATSPARITVSSLDQLEETNNRLGISLHRFSEGKNGVSLAEMVETIENSIGHSASVVTEFRRKLMLYGYDPDAAYAERTYVQEDVRRFVVGKGFPRLTRATVPAGIVAATYQVDCGGLGEYALDKSAFQDFVSGRS